MGLPFSWLLAPDFRLLSWCLGVFVVALLGLARAALAQRQTDVIGMHDLSLAGTSPIKGTLSGSCSYCHAPHSGLNGTAGVAQTPLWDQKLSSVQAYTVYTSTTLVDKPNPSLPLGTDSTLCLSCHDGTVAGSPGALVPYGNVPMSGQMYPTDVFGTNLSTMHPINFILPLKSPNNGGYDVLVQSLTANPPSTADQTGKVRLINGNVECTSCHNPHVQNIDPNSNFLVINNSSSALCLACHSTIPTGSGRGLTNSLEASHNAMNAVGSQLTARAAASNTNPLAGWSTGIHATAANKVAPQISLATSSGVASRATTSPTQASLGPYPTVAKNGCSSCHAEHNAQGQNSLLRAVDDQTCLVCHNGSSNISPAISNVLAEMVAPKYGHAFSVGNTPHRANEAVLLNQNLHVTCVDCHNPHSTNRVAIFPAAPTIRPSQTMVTGISATDGKTVVSPAVNQYENCLRCHGTSTGKKMSINFGYLPFRVVSASDRLNVIPEFSSFATSSHPVFHDRSSTFPQPSLRTNMLNLDGRTLGRSMGARILCTDCHNSDDNREFGGSGPSGPHGSIFPHILERRYEFSQSPLPGKLVTNLFPNPTLSVEGGASGGPYALCAKCHDLTQIMNNTSFSEHARHVKQDGFSCSVCHTAHGMGAQSGTISGERLVNFDANVVAPNGGAPISYNHATNSCGLVCHNHSHQLRTAAGVGKR
ncbi:MAG: cytochrome c3 family protein [Terriglobia bacterium]|jgi:predicted CXXCH cytochrome family protein